MSEHKRERDDLLKTGAHHAWTGEPAGSGVRAGNKPGDQQHNWLDRNQPANPRHAAITRSLNSWSNYKSWTDKVRNSWDKDKK